jgi:hypothetical protein
MITPISIALMTPDDFRLAIVPRLALMKPDCCLCSNRSFRKLISFEFQDYGIAPTGLADAEVLINEVLRDKLRYRLKTSNTGGTFTCLACQSVLVETYDEYSISMSRSTIAWDEKKTVRGSYVVGFFGFTGADYARINDFDSVELENLVAMLGLTK